MQKVRVWEGVTSQQFTEDIIPLYQPAVLKGICAEWDLVKQSRSSSEALCSYLQNFDQGGAVGVFRTTVEDKGHIKYSADAQSFNFSKARMAFNQALKEILAGSQPDAAFNIYMGSVALERCAPQLIAKLPMPLLSTRVMPKLWMGNKSVVQPHFDVSDNIAVVAAGKRRFTLFPPEQINNLYIGPIDITPAGQPMSRVSLIDPDLEKFPRYQDALAVAQVAELEPGDAIFIPSLWWHGVEALESFNLLINYWWNQHSLGVDSAHEAMIHGILTISQLPLAERRAWKAFFDHYVFQEHEHPLADLPENARGVLASMTPDLYRIIRDYLHVRMGIK